MKGRDTELSRAARMIDSQIGKRLRHRRNQMGMTQSDLAERLDLSYQQLQKYETAGNRVSAGRLWQIAKILEVEPSYFFEDVEDSTEYEEPKDDARRRAAQEVVEDFENIQSADVRAATGGLLKTLAGGRKGKSY